MKRFKRILRLCALMLFMLLAATGISILGCAPTLTRDRKLFADIEVTTKNKEEESSTSAEFPGDKKLKR